MVVVDSHHDNSDFHRAGCRDVQLTHGLVNLRLRFNFWLSLVLLQSAQLTNHSLALLVVGIYEYSLGFKEPRNNNGNVIGQLIPRDVIDSCSVAGASRRADK